MKKTPLARDVRAAKRAVDKVLRQRFVYPHMDREPKFKKGQKVNVNGVPYRVSRVEDSSSPGAQYFWLEEIVAKVKS